MDRHSHESRCRRRDRVVHLAVALALFASLGPLAAGPVAAQGGEELRAYLDRTDELLEWAADQVGQSGSDRARQVLTQAQQLQARGRELLARQRPLEAFSVGRRARDAMWHAVRLARESAGLEERVRLRAERFADQHAQLVERAREDGAPRAVELLEKAGDQARRADERAAQGDLQLAWRLLEQAEDLLRLAARQLAEGGGAQRLDRELDRARQLVDETADRLGGAAVPPGALALLAEARESLDRAQAAASGGDPGLALQSAALARRLAQRALALAGTRAEASTVESLLARFDERAGELAGRIRDSGSAAAARAFERAREQREGAAQSLGEGKAERALRQARAAHDLLEQAARELR